MVDSKKGKREKSRKKQRISLGDIVVPVILAIENRQRLSEVEVQEAKRREGPLIVV